MRQSTQDIILRAKQQPRQGMADINDLNALLNTLDAGIAGAINTLGIFTSETGQTLNATSKLTTAFDGISTAVAKQTETMLWLEKRNQSLQKTFMMTRKDAATFGQEIDKLSEGFKVGGKVMRAYVENLKGVSRGFAGSSQFINSGFGKQLIKIQDDLVRTMGLSKETANQYTKMMVGRGGNIEEELKKQVAIAEAIKQSTGYQDAQKDILEGMADLSADIEAHYNRIPGSLELGILKAKQLGLSVEDMYNAGSKMLSVEETINKELELQALTGQRLLDQDGASLINKYQQAQLNGDLNAQADIMSEIMTQMGDTIKTNPYARQALADLTGLTAAQLVNTTREMALISKTEGAGNLMAKNAESVITESAGYQGTLETQRGGELQTTEGLLQNQRDITETAMINENIKDAASLVKDNSDKQVELMSTLGETFKELNKTIFAALKPVLSVGMPLAAMTEIATAIGEQLTFTSTGTTTITANDVLLQTNSTPLTTTTSPAQLADGGVVPAGYPNDTYPALLSSGETVTPPGKLPTGDMSQFASAIVSAIKQQTVELTSNSSMNPSLWT